MMRANTTRFAVPAVLACALACTFVPAVARADEGQAPPPKTSNAELSKYEQETMKIGLEKFTETIDPNPEGKVIERIDIVTLDVFEERDVIPQFADERPWLKKTLVTGRRVANWIHFTSKDFTIRREMLFREGDPYTAVLAEETARNLRGLSQLSTVVIVAVKSETDPNKVRVLVVTKDVWSLRLNWNVSYTNGRLGELTFQPQERNVLGLHHTASTLIDILPLSTTLGASYSVPRFGTSRIGANAGASIVLDRHGSPEGSAFSAGIGQPLYSAQTEWAWNVSGSYSSSVLRRYINGELAGFDSLTTPQIDGIPFEYRGISAAEGASVTRSFGWTNKFDFTLGFGASQSSYRTFDNLSGFDPRAVADFQSLLPVGENRVGPSITMTSYATKFQAMHDLSSLALQEDYRLGHYVSVKLYRASKELGSTRDVAGAYGGAQYTIPVGDGLMRASIEGTVEQQEDKGQDTISDASWDASFKFATPRFAWGRFFVDTGVLDRVRNYLNVRDYLGGSGRLRGYPTNAYLGKDFYVANLEFRSRPISILTAQVGGVVFHDMGDAFQDFDVMRLKHSVGGGVRVLFPELDRSVFRFDLAFPLNRPDASKNDAYPCGPPGSRICKIDPVSYYLTFGQAFDFTSIAQ
jgi:hypothetical protein